MVHWLQWLLLSWMLCKVAICHHWNAQYLELHFPVTASFSSHSGMFITSLCNLRIFTHTQASCSAARLHRSPGCCLACDCFMTCRSLCGLLLNFLFTKGRKSCVVCFCFLLKIGKTYFLYLSRRCQLYLQDTIAVRQNCYMTPGFHLLLPMRKLQSRIIDFPTILIIGEHRTLISTVTSKIIRFCSPFLYGLLSAKVSRRRRNSVLVPPVHGNPPLLITHNALSAAIY